MTTSIAISNLPTAGAITGAELVPVVQGGSTAKATVTQITAAATAAAAAASASAATKVASVTASAPLASSGGTTPDISFTGTLAVANGGTGITSFGAGVATWLGTPNSANLAAAVTDETGSGALVFGTSPTLSGATLNGTTVYGGAVTPATLTADSVGYTGIPINSQSAAYGILAADAGKTILHPITDNNPRTFTIPANGSIAFPIGTTITFVNMINTVTIAITTDTMYLAGAGTTGSRTLAAYGMATAVKVSSTSWIISGNGLT
jgi:hypothetical protein